MFLTNITAFGTSANSNFAESFCFTFEVLDVIYRDLLDLLWKMNTHALSRHDMTLLFRPTLSFEYPCYAGHGKKTCLLHRCRWELPPKAFQGSWEQLLRGSKQHPTWQKRCRSQLLHCCVNILYLFSGVMFCDFGYMVYKWLLLPFPGRH